MIAWFGILSALMAGVALAFLLWPLFRKGGRGKPMGLGIGLAFALPMAALGLYLAIGTPGALNPAAYDAPQAKQLSLTKAVQQLQERLETSPGDLDGWTLLAQARKAMGEPAKAAAAWDRALAIKPDSAMLLIASAEAHTLANPQHQIGPKARQKLVKALKIEPTQQRGLWFKGVSDFQQGQYEDAVSTWQRLLALVDAKANPNVAAGIRSQIERARQAADMPVASAGNAPARSTSTQQPASAPAIQVEVSLAPKLKASAKADSTVFVFARAANGPSMPLAVKRLRVADLPAKVTLDDSAAMLPQRKLSGVDKAEIGALVSASGKATPQAGDLEASAVTVDTSSRAPVRLRIDHAL